MPKLGPSLTQTGAGPAPKLGQPSPVQAGTPVSSQGRQLARVVLINQDFSPNPIKPTKGVVEVFGVVFNRTLVLVDLGFPRG